MPFASHIAVAALITKAMPGQASAGIPFRIGNKCLSNAPRAIETVARPASAR
jgi:hypothetical protein